MDLNGLWGAAVRAGFKFRFVAAGFLIDSSLWCEIG